MTSCWARARSCPPAKAPPPLARARAEEPVIQSRRVSMANSLWCDCHLDFAAASDASHYVGEIGLQREQPAVHFARSLRQPAAARKHFVGKRHHARVRPGLRPNRGETLGE